MLHLLALAVGLGLPVVRPADGGPRVAPRYVRLRLDIVAYGVPGRGEMLLDRATGRYVRRFDAGPVSEREGWDGTRAWRADATGMPRVQGNADLRDAIIAWSYLAVRAPSTEPRVTVLPAELAKDHTPPLRSARIRYAGHSRDVEVVTAPLTGLVTRVVRHAGEDTVTTTFDDYRAADSLVVPFTFAETSENGRWSARVVGVETPSAVSDRAFAPPPAPADSSLAGTTSLPMLGPLQQPVIEVRVDDGPPLHVVLDTGGQNVLTPDAARRSGLAVVGSGTVGGAGAGLVPVRYATARRVRVGMAEMRGQPFLVLDLGAGFPVDGIVGYELLARFAARVDFAHKRVDLAPRAAAFGNAGTVVPFVFEERMPQADGAIDGVPAALTIDTGSTSALDVNAPFVRAHALVQRYSAVPVGTSIYGVGGGVRASVGRAKVLRLGSVRVPNVRLLLTDASAGFESNPSVAGNVGDEVLRRFVIVFDYRAMTMRFVPVGALTATRTSPARVQALPVGSLRKPGRRVATGGRRTRP